MGKARIGSHSYEYNEGTKGIQDAIDYLEKHDSTRRDLRKEAEENEQGGIGEASFSAPDEDGESHHFRLLFHKSDFSYEIKRDK